MYVYVYTYVTIRHLRQAAEGASGWKGTPGALETGDPTRPVATGTSHTTRPHGPPDNLMYSTNQHTYLPCLLTILSYPLKVLQVVVLYGPTI